MPLRTSRPPRRDARDERRRELDQRLCLDVGEHSLVALAQRRPRPSRRRRPAPSARCASAFSRVTATASGSMSMARTASAPSASATSARTPLPHPTSSTRQPRRASPRSARTSATRRVVSCSPVPNARPGSSSMTRSPGSAAYGAPGRPHHDAARRSRNGSKCFFHSSRHASPTTCSRRGDHAGRQLGEGAARPRSRPRSWRPASPCPSAPRTSVVASRSSTPWAPSSKRRAPASSASSVATSTATYG